MIFVLLAGSSVMAQETLPPAEIVNDEGGAVVVTGTLTVTNPNLKVGVAEPLVILEDQAGFIDRDHRFLLPRESQTLGQFTSDFFADAPITYSLALPAEPQGSFRDVDNDGEADTGVQVFAAAYWANVFGDPFLEQRDQVSGGTGGGWSTAYASTRVSFDPATLGEVIGGVYIVYAPDGEQGFPSGFGADGILFTADDPVVGLPPGYTVVNMDGDPFMFDRSRAVVIDLIEPEEITFDDFSQMGYAEAFDALVEKARTDYAFTDYKHIDWEALAAKYRPRFEEAEANQDSAAYHFALRDFMNEIPDGHLAVIAESAVLRGDQAARTDGGLGMSLTELDDGRVIVSYLSPNRPAREAGIALGAEVLEIGGVPIGDAIAQTYIFRPQSVPALARLQQVRHVIRFPVATEVEIAYQNPDADAPTTVTLTTVAERASFNVSTFRRGVTGSEAPVEHDIRSDGFGYLKLNSFNANAVLTVQALEFFLALARDDAVPGIIIDLRTNAGGFPFFAEQLSGYFFDAEVVTGNRSVYKAALDDFYYDPDTPVRVYPPPQENLRYLGPVAVLVGPGCASACERFAYNMTLRDNTQIVGQYPTAGLGGGVESIAMPDGVTFNLTTVRSVDPQGEIHIEGKGVVPTLRVPVDEATALDRGDPVLDAAVAWLESVQG